MTLVEVDSSQQELLERYLQHSQISVQRRAQLVLLYHAGQDTRAVAAQVGLSMARTRYWRLQFERRGMAIFPEPAPEKTFAAPAPVDAPQPAAEELPVAPVDTPTPSKKNLPFPSPMECPGVLPDDPIAEAGRKVMLYQFGEMLRHEDGTIIGEDIEALHDMRVATRRMRAAFDVFGFAFRPKTVTYHLKGLRRAGRALGKVRDMDVFIEKGLSYLAGLPPAEQSGLEPLLYTWREEREIHRREMIDHLSSEQYARFKQDFNWFVQTVGAGVNKSGGPEVEGVVIPVVHLTRHIVPALVYQRLAAVRAYDSVVPQASIIQLHALRIEFKKLRYTLEYFQEVLGQENKAAIAEIKKLQDHLGDLHDAEVACQLLQRFLTEWDQRQANVNLADRQDPQPIAAYLTTRHAERHQLMTSFPQVWAEFQQGDFQRNLALAVSTL